MPRVGWRRGRAFEAPIDHLSADRLADIVNAERSSTPDLATLRYSPGTLQHALQQALLEAPPDPEPPPEAAAGAEADSGAEAPSEVAVEALLEVLRGASPGAPPEAWPGASATPADSDPPDGYDNAWDDSVPAAQPPPPPHFAGTPAGSLPAGARKAGRHRRPKSLKSAVRRMARAVRSARSIALLGILLLFVIGTAVMALK
jgi:hypothetical protein